MFQLPGANERGEDSGLRIDAMRLLILLCLVALPASCQIPTTGNVEQQSHFVASVLAQKRFYARDADGDFQIFNEVCPGTGLFSVLYDSHEDGVADYISRATQFDVRLAEAVADYFSQNETGGFLDSIPLEGVAYKPFREAEDASPRDRPSGILFLSKPGFSKDGTVGVMYVCQSSFRCASSGLEAMRLEDGLWQSATEWSVGWRTR